MRTTRTPPVDPPPTPAPAGRRTPSSSRASRRSAPRPVKARSTTSRGWRNRSVAREHVRAVIAQPQHLRPDVERVGEVTGARVHDVSRRSGRASSPPRRSPGYRDTSSRGRPARPAASNGRHRRALPGEPDRGDAITTAGTQRTAPGPRPRRATSRASPTDPARPSPGCGVTVAYGRRASWTTLPGAIDRHRPRPGRPRIDGDEQRVGRHASATHQLM